MEFAVQQAAALCREHRHGRTERTARMITLTTYEWVPDFAAPLMRAFRVRWALEEAGLPYQVRTVALGPEQRSPEHLARQPFGQAPAIEEDGLVLFESGAIALYIAEKSEALLPDGPHRARAGDALGVLGAELGGDRDPAARRDRLLPHGRGMDQGAAAAGRGVRARPAVDAGAGAGREGLSRRALHRWRPDDGGRAAHPRHTDLLRVSDAEGVRERCEARPAFQRAMKAQMEGFGRRRDLLVNFAPGCPPPGEK